MDGSTPATSANSVGRRLGLDPGEARIGVACSDPSGVLATPLETVPRGGGDLARLCDIVTEHDIVRVYLGLPRSLSGSEGPAAARVRAFAEELEELIAPVPIYLQDERLTTVSAEAMLRERGRFGQQRRAVVDQVAATVILQTALDRERATGKVPGEIMQTKGDLGR